jgi:hypothetical protein
MLLDNATSTAPADVQNRHEVAWRVKKYNKALKAACKAYPGRCLWDGGRVYDMPFSTKHVSKWDFFHPSAAGSQRLAELTFRRDLTRK